jgi:hypothetical protein
MKKIVLLLISFIVFSSNIFAIPPGQWLGQIFGRTCQTTWPSGGATANIGAGSGCGTPVPAGKCCNAYVEVCSSWLWGSKSTNFSQWGDCSSSDIPNSIKPPISGNSVYAEMADFWTNHSNISGVKDEWKNPESLENNGTLLMESVVFRFQLAGYNCNPSWFTITGVCNFNSAPTLPIQIPLPPNQLDGC